MDEVLKDKVFYDNSEGGVTLSGGDPIMQPEFSLELLRKCKEQGLHTAIETCELTSWPILKGLLDHTDLILYDSKCLDPIKQRTWAQREGEDFTIEPMFCWTIVDRIEPVEISPKGYRKAVYLIRQRMEQEEISFKGWLKKQKEGRKR
jgi:organic radical activating enzyme